MLMCQEAYTHIPPQDAATLIDIAMQLNGSCSHLGPFVVAGNTLHLCRFVPCSAK